MVARQDGESGVRIARKSDNSGMGRMGRIGGRYRLVERLGTGGMSIVWRGYDEILGRQVAIKVLSPQLAGDDSVRGRLRQEATAAARLCHPHITAIYDLGESPPYVVMELIDGESLADRLCAGPMPWREAVAIAREVASALAAAHARGVVHRDVTPANVMLTAAGAKVVDFGISALVGQPDAAPDGSLLGTPAYLAPERLEGREVTTATDIYALGLLLYRALTARLPWPAGNTAEALRAHLYADPAPLPPLPGLPAEVGELCVRCLAKDPEDRPGSAEVATALAEVAGVRVVVAPTLLPGPALEPGPIRSTAHRDVRLVAPVYPMRAPARAAALRLRTGLRIASALRVGAARSLGGGLFGGGRLVRDFASGLFAGRHKLQAALLSAALLVIVGMTWSSTRDPVEVGPVQAAAGNGPIAGAARRADCRVRYWVKRDSGTDFAADLTVVNAGSHTLTGWLLAFAYSGNQRVTAGRGFTQHGRSIVLHGTSLRALEPGGAVTVALRGEYRDRNPLPLVFALNRRSCVAEVIGATGRPAVSAPAATRVAEAAGTGRGM